MELDQKGCIVDTVHMSNRRIVLLGALMLVAALAVGAVFLLGGDAPGTGTPSERILVVVDAGHGGRDPGAVYDGVEEADVNLAVMQRVAALIEADDRLTVRMTRALDVYVSLEDRIAVANDAGADLYLSIQSNACGYLDVTGIETLVSDQLDPGAPSWQFAEVLQDAVTDATGARDRGVRSQDLYLHRATMPAALIEVGFLSNDAERARLLDPSYRGIVAEAIHRGIVAYLEYARPDFPPDTS